MEPLNFDDLIKEQLTPQQRVNRTKQFIDELEEVQLKYYTKCVKDLNLPLWKAHQLYSYFFNDGPQVWVENDPQYYDKQN